MGVTSRALSEGFVFSKKSLHASNSLRTLLKENFYATVVAPEAFSLAELSKEEAFTRLGIAYT